MCRPGSNASTISGETHREVFGDNLHRLNKKEITGSIAATGDLFTIWF